MWRPAEPTAARCWAWLFSCGDFDTIAGFSSSSSLSELEDEDEDDDDDGSEVLLLLLSELELDDDDGTFFAPDPNAAPALADAGLELLFFDGGAWTESLLLLLLLELLSLSLEDDESESESDEEEEDDDEEDDKEEDDDEEEEEELLLEGERLPLSRPLFRLAVGMGGRANREGSENTTSSNFFPLSGSSAASESSFAACPWRCGPMARAASTIPFRRRKSLTKGFSRSAWVAVMIALSSTQRRPRSARRQLLEKKILRWPRDTALHPVLAAGRHKRERATGHRR